MQDQVPQINNQLQSSLLEQVKQLFLFSNLTQNDFLLKKFDRESGCITVYWLARENSVRQFSQNENELGIQLLQSILTQYNYQTWIYDYQYDVVTPLFPKVRRQIQVLIPRLQRNAFQTYLQELDLKFEFKPQTKDYLANPDLVKLFLVLHNDEDALYAFRKIQDTKFQVCNIPIEVWYTNSQNGGCRLSLAFPESNYSQTIQVSYLSTHRQQKMNKRNYYQNGYGQAEFQSNYQQQMPNANQYSYQQPIAQEQDELINQYLENFRTNSKIDFNYAPLHDPFSLTSLLPQPIGIQEHTTHEIIAPSHYQQLEQQYQQKQDPDTSSNGDFRQDNNEFIENQQNDLQEYVGDFKSFAPRETESNKENSIERNQNNSYSQQQHKGKFRQDRKPYYRGNNDYKHKGNEYNQGQGQIYRQHKPNTQYLKLEDDLREFTGYKKQYQPKNTRNDYSRHEYFEKKEQ